MNYIEYWNNRYEKGGNSGKGSYGKLAEFKANIINNFIIENNVKALIDIGCGDGNNLNLINIDFYIGLDISKEAIEICKNKYLNDISKSFLIYNAEFKETSNLVLCLDVLYHITDDLDYYKTLNNIFSISNKYVILYTTINDYKVSKYKGGHVKHRNILQDLEKINNFSILKIIPQLYKEESSADFIILKKNNEK